MHSLGLIRVCHVVNSLQPGGMENGIVNVASALAGEEFEFHVFCLERSGPFAERLPRPDFVKILGKRSGFSMDAVRNLGRASQEVVPTVLHTHNIGPLIYATLAKLHGHHQIVHGEHSQFTPEDLQPKRLLQRRALYGLCQQIHTVSEGQRRELIALGFSPESIQAISNGVDVSRFKSADKAKRRSDFGMDDGFWMGIVGRFGPQKGHETLIEAFEKLAPTHPDLRLMIVGSGGPKEEPTRERVTRSPFAERILFSGFHKDTSPVYQALDLLVVPSTNEGLSNVVLEAMASGLPVLAHHACGNDEAIIDGRTGFLRALDTPETLSTALREVISNRELLPTLGSNGRKRVERDFSLDHMVRQYAALYRRLASRNLLAKR